MPIFNTDLEFEVYCDTCGEDLSAFSRITKIQKPGVSVIRVVACPRCTRRHEAAQAIYLAWRESLREV